MDNFKQHIEDRAAHETFIKRVFDHIENDLTWFDFKATCDVLGVFDIEDLDELLSVMYTHNTTDFLQCEHVKTRYGWRSHGGCFSAYCPRFSEVSSRVYWHFLEILPPYYHAHGFAVSEPYSVDYTLNKTTYAHFAKNAGRHYFLGDIARCTVSDVFTQLLNQLEQVQ